MSTRNYEILTQILQVRYVSQYGRTENGGRKRRSPRPLCPCKMRLIIFNQQIYHKDLLGPQVMMRTFNIFII